MVVRQSKSPTHLHLLTLPGVYGRSQIGSPVPRTKLPMSGSGRRWRPPDTPLTAAQAWDGKVSNLQEEWRGEADGVYSPTPPRMAQEGEEVRKPGVRDPPL